jgi:arabinose-5-phosphate isomerase
MTVGDRAQLQQAVAVATSVLEESARAVTRVCVQPGDLDGALEVLLATRGRVVFTGLGKSGLIAGKLAATFASTGTPAQFVHAADAFHGDAGMVTSDDVLVALSKSGTTVEVVEFARLIKARGVPVLTITGCGRKSPLCALADVSLDARVERECDPWDLVPSASTTVSLVVGDALAIALMVARGFGPDQFYAHHRGGVLGARLEAGLGGRQ